VSPPDFSGFADTYARARPTYPDALFAHLASLVEPRRLAWDCATGNGQAARGLTPWFERVIATDTSAAQIAQAPPHPQITYAVAPAEASGLEPSSVDLATVAAAVHWFDPPRFHAEVRRVVRPGGVLAVWSYHVAHLDPPFEEVLGPFCRDVVRPYFDDGAKLVDERYETLPMPGEPIAAPAFHVEVEWTCGQIVDFVRSWSGVQKYAAAHGEDPVARIVPALERLCGDPRTAHRLRWPLYLRIARL